MSAILKNKTAVKTAGFESPPMRDLFENKMAANKRDSPNNPNGNQLIFLSCHLKNQIQYT